MTFETETRPSVSETEMQDDRLNALVEFWGGVWLALGALGVIVTSGLYLASPLAAVLPVPNAAMAEALSAAASGHGFMRAAGTVGIPSDIALASGALVLMAYRTPSGHPIESIGWAFAAIGTLVFIVVDALAGHVLSQVASLPCREAAFFGFKRLFDVLFTLGTIATGAANLSIFWSAIRTTSPVLPHAVSLIGLVVGAVAILSGFACLAGITLAQLMGASLVAWLMGLSIPVTALLYAILGARIAWAAHLKSRFVL
jgi:hypothetical protein